MNRDFVVVFGARFLKQKDGRNLWVSSYREASHFNDESIIDALISVDRPVVIAYAG